MAIRSKLPNVGTTIFSKMSALAHTHKAVNLSQGFPDFDCDPRLTTLVSEHMRTGHNQYAPMPGLLELREQISLKYARWHEYEYDPDTEVTVTAGATQALFTAITALVHPDDEVIVIEPAYDCYGPAIALAGGRAIPVAMDLTARDLDVAAIAAAISPKTRCILINSPHNPTGVVVSKAAMTALEVLLAPTDIIVMSDEVYEHMVFDGGTHESIARYPRLRERSLLISSFGKTYHTTGWKIGYVCGPSALMSEFRKVHQYNVFSVHRPTQHAYADYMRSGDGARSLDDFYQVKRDLFCDALEGSSFRFTPTEGTYFQLLDYSPLSNDLDIEVAEKWTKHKGIASIPISVFYTQPPRQHYLRFCFAKSEETLLRAAALLRDLTLDDHS